MSKSKLKILAVFLSLTMTVQMLPAFVLAEGQDNEPDEQKTVESSEPETKEKTKTETKEPKKPDDQGDKKVEKKEESEPEVTKAPEEKAAPESKEAPDAKEEEKPGEPAADTEEKPEDKTAPEPEEKTEPEQKEGTEPEEKPEEPEKTGEVKAPSQPVKVPKKGDQSFPLSEGATAKSITLRWDPVPNATGYEVWRADSVDGEYVLLSTNIDLNSPLYFDAPLEAGKYYYYKIVVHIEGEEDRESKTEVETDVVEINTDTFPDEVWRGYVTENVDKDNSGGLNRSELGTSISLTNLDVKNMKGIEWFTISRLNISGAKNLSSLDLSKNANMIQVEIKNCDLTSLSGFNFGPNTKSLTLSNNKLVNVTISEPVSLQSLDVRNNPITSLNVSALSNLWSLYCGDCKLSSLDVSQNGKLGVLYCARNNLTALDLSKNDKLTLISCEKNIIEDFKFNPANEFSGLYLEQNNIPLEDLPDFSLYPDLQLNSKKFPQRWMTPKYIKQLKVTTTTDTSISLAWEKIDTADGYYVYQAASVNAQVVKKATINNNETVEWTATGLTTGNSYYFYVLPFKKITDGGEEFNFTSDDFYEVDAEGTTHTYHNGVSAKAQESSYSVNVIAPTNGTVVVDLTSAKKNQLVTITVTPAEGYKCTGISVKTESGTDVYVADNNVFVMPGENVNVTATFEKEKYYVLVIYDSRILTVTGIDNSDEAYSGDKYSFTVGTKTEDFVLDYVSANDVKIQPDSEGVYHVTQPAGNLTICVVAREKDDVPTIDLGDKAEVNECEYTVTNNAVDGKGTVAFEGVKTPVEAVSIPSTVNINGVNFKVTKIASGAFFNDTVLKTVTIGSNVLVIDTNAFYGCTNLVKVSGCKGLKTIGVNAFARCSKLSSFTVTSSVLSKIGTKAFYKDTKLKTLYIKYTTKLSKSGVKKSLSGSSVKTVKVKKSKVKKYKKYFKKSNSGRKVTVKK